MARYAGCMYVVVRTAEAAAMLWHREGKRYLLQPDEPAIRDPAVMASAVYALEMGGHGVAPGAHTVVWVPIIRSWALTRGFALHPGTSKRYEIRYTRTQHRPASRQVNDHGRVSGTRRPPLPLSDPGATNQVKPEAPNPRRGDDRGVEQFEPRLGARRMP